MSAHVAYDFTKGSPGDVIVWANMGSSTHHPTRVGVHSVFPVTQGTKRLLQFWVKIRPICKGTLRTEGLEKVINPYRSKTVRARRKPCKAQTQHDQGQYMTKLTLDELQLPHVFPELLTGRLLRDILDYEQKIGAVGSEKEVEYAAAEADGKPPQDAHRFRAEPEGQAWKKLQQRILIEIATHIDDVLEPEPALRDQCHLMLQWNDGGFVLVTETTTGNVWMHHDLCELDDDGEIDMDDFLKKNSIEYDGEIELLGKRKREAVHKQEVNLGRQLTVLIPLEAPKKGGEVVFPNT